MDREKGILALVISIISSPPPPTQIISARYITVEPQSSRQSRFLIIKNYMNIDGVFLVATSIISKDNYHNNGKNHLWNSQQLSFSIQVKALVQYRSLFQRQFIKQNKIVTSHQASENASLFMKKSQGNKKSGSYNQGPDNRGSTKLFYEQLCCLILTATQKIIIMSVKCQVHLCHTMPRMK